MRLACSNSPSNDARSTGPSPECDIGEIELFYRIVTRYATLFYVQLAQSYLLPFIHFLIDTDFANAYNGLKLIAAYRLPQ